MKRKLREFPVTENALLPVGTCIGVRHFVPGQFVDVAGITMGKGFQVYFYFSSQLLSAFGFGLYIFPFLPSWFLSNLFKFENEFARFRKCERN